MKDTRLSTNYENLCILALAVGSKETKDLFKSALDSWNLNSGHKLSWKDKAELLMECYYTFPQTYIIVKIIDTKTWGLIKESENPLFDCQEYIELASKNKIKEWFI